MRRPKAGRPVKPEAQKKSETLELRINSLEKEAFKKASSIAGIGLSAWARERLRVAAMRELDEATQPIPFLQSLSTD